MGFKFSFIALILSSVLLSACKNLSSALRGQVSMPTSNPALIEPIRAELTAPATEGQTISFQIIRRDTSTNQSVSWQVTGDTQILSQTSGQVNFAIGESTQAVSLSTNLDSYQQSQYDLTLTMLQDSKVIKQFAISVADSNEYPSLSISAHSVQKFRVGVGFEETVTVFNWSQTTAVTITGTSFSSANGFNFKGGNFPGTGGSCSTSASIAPQAQCTLVIQRSNPAVGDFQSYLDVVVSSGSSSIQLRTSLSARVLNPTATPTLLGAASTSWTPTPLFNLGRDIQFNAVPGTGSSQAYRYKMALSSGDCAVNAFYSSVVSGPTTIDWFYLQQFYTDGSYAGGETRYVCILAVSEGVEQAASTVSPLAILIDQKNPMITYVSMNNAGGGMTDTITLHLSEPLYLNLPSSTHQQLQTSSLYVVDYPGGPSCVSQGVDLYVDSINGLKTTTITLGLQYPIDPGSFEPYEIFCTTFTDWTYDDQENPFRLTDRNGNLMYEY